MSKFTGTPGPWEISELIVNSNGERTGVFIAKTGGGIVGQSYINCTVYDLEASLRNARLMAAAPDLLEACLRARNQFYAAGYEPKAGSMNPAECLLAQLIAAISKALGEE